MKASFLKKGLLCLLVLSSVLFCSGAFGVADLNMIYHVSDGLAIAVAIAPIGITGIGSISAGDLEALKLKYGRIKILTVVVEPEVLDIDLLSKEDAKALEALKINSFLIGNKNLSLEERLKELSKLDSIESKDKPHLTGAIVTPGESYHFAVRRPDRSHIKMLLPLAQAKEIDEFSDKAVKNLIVGGDVEALEDGLVFMGVVSKLKELISPANSFLANA